MSLNKCCSLHLECENLGHLVDPCRLIGFVPLTVSIVLVIGHLGAEYILPRLVKVRLVLNVQDDVVLDGRLCSALRQLFFVDKLDKIFDITVEHLAERVTILLFLLRCIIHLHHLIKAWSASTHRLSSIAFGAKVISPRK